MSRRSPPARARKRARRSAALPAKRTGAARGGRAAAAAKRAAAPRGIIALPAECTLAGAEGLKLRLATLLRDENCVTVDVSGVRRIDTASLQLLAAFARDRSCERLAVELRGDSPAFAEGVRLLGLARLFDLAAGARPD
jgi:anti-anti-sigma regulatory factor